MMQKTNYRSFVPCDEVLTRFKIKVNRSGLVIPLYNRRGIEVARIPMWPSSKNEVSALTQSSKGPILGKNRRVLPKGSLVYNWDSIPNERDYIILTFGITAVWKLWSHGFPDVIGLLKNTINERQIGYVSSIVKKKGIVWVLTDGSGFALQYGAAVTGKLTKIRFARHIFIVSKQIENCSAEELQALFSRS